MDREGLSLRKAAGKVAGELGGTSSRTLERWCAACRGHAPQDWMAVLLPGRGGGARKAEFDERTWEWFWTDYGNPCQSDLAMSWRRAQETAAHNGWGLLPSIATVRRMVAALPKGAVTLAREGKRAAVQMHPPQRIDRSEIPAGHYVSGDGVQISSLWVDWGGDVINTSTVWVWADMRTSYIMAHKAGPSETTDLVRLATYELTGVCLPHEAQTDNTRAVSGKDMTGGAKNRHRFKNKDSDPEGLLFTIGMRPQFTNPDRVFGQPGAKLVERLFGTGGLHHAIKTHPRLRDRGFSKETAIPAAELVQVVAEEVRRWNERPGRRTATCAGRSCREAFEEDFARHEQRKLAPQQRNLLLLRPKKVKMSSRWGEITIPVGTGQYARPRYWSAELENWMGRHVHAYYNPDDLTQPVTVRSLEGKPICVAEHNGDTVFRDTQAASEHAKNRRRSLKAKQKNLEAIGRMGLLEYQAATRGLRNPRRPRRA